MNLNHGGKRDLDLFEQRLMRIQNRSRRLFDARGGERDDGAVWHGTNPNVVEPELRPGSGRSARLFESCFVVKDRFLSWAYNGSLDNPA